MLAKYGASPGVTELGAVAADALLFAGTIIGGLRQKLAIWGTEAAHRKSVLLLDRAAT